MHIAKVHFTPSQPINSKIIRFVKLYMSFQCFISLLLLSSLRRLKKNAYHKKGTQSNKVYSLISIPFMSLNCVGRATAKQKCPNDATNGGRMHGGELHFLGANEQDPPLGFWVKQVRAKYRFKSWLHPIPFHSSSFWFGES